MSMMDAHQTWVAPVSIYTPRIHTICYNLLQSQPSWFLDPYHIYVTKVVSTRFNTEMPNMLLPSRDA
jgi:hypothetical protein